MEFHSACRGLGIAVSAGLLSAAVTRSGGFSRVRTLPGQQRRYRYSIRRARTPSARRVTAAAAGDTVEISGTCKANVTVTQDITLDGKGKGATLDGRGQGPGYSKSRGVPRRSASSSCAAVGRTRQAAASSSQAATPPP